MRVRAIDVNHDWEFGKGQNDYKTGNDAIAQDIDTRLNCFLNDCFFDTGAGIDWFNQLGAKDQLQLNLSISAVILNTDGVVGILQLSSNLSQNRNFTVAYRVQTIYSQTAGTFSLDLNGSG